MSLTTGSTRITRPKATNLSQNRRGGLSAIEKMKMNEIKVRLNHLTKDRCFHHGRVQKVLGYHQSTCIIVGTFNGCSHYNHPQFSSTCVHMYACI